MEKGRKSTENRAFAPLPFGSDRAVHATGRHGPRKERAATRTLVGVFQKRSLFLDVRFQESPNQSRRGKQEARLPGLEQEGLGGGYRLGLLGLLSPRAHLALWLARGLREEGHRQVSPDLLTG